jgi:helix-turn-helix protein
MRYGERRTFDAIQWVKTAIVHRVLREYPASSGKKKLVLAVLASFADHADGANAYPSVATVARLSGLTERCVSMIYAQLKAEGVLIVEVESKGGPRKTTRYRIVLPTTPKTPQKTLKPISGLEPANPEIGSTETLKSEAPNPEAGFPLTLKPASPDLNILTLTTTLKTHTPRACARDPNGECVCVSSSDEEVTATATPNGNGNPDCEDYFGSLVQLYGPQGGSISRARELWAKLWPEEMCDELDAAIWRHVEHPKVRERLKLGTPEAFWLWKYLHERRWETDPEPLSRAEIEEERRS